MKHNTRQPVVVEWLFFGNRYAVNTINLNGRPHGGVNETCRRHHSIGQRTALRNTFFRRVRSTARPFLRKTRFNSHKNLCRELVSTLIRTKKRA